MTRIILQPSPLRYDPEALMVTVSAEDVQTHKPCDVVLAQGRGLVDLACGIAQLIESLTGSLRGLSPKAHPEHRALVGQRVEIEWVDPEGQPQEMAGTLAYASASELVVDYGYGLDLGFSARRIVVRPERDENAIEREMRS